MQALFLLAFAIGLARPGAVALGWRARGSRPRSPWRRSRSGSVYSYSFPGLVWLVGAAGAWAVVELWAAAARRRAGGRGRCCSEPCARRRLRWVSSSRPSRRSSAGWSTSQSFETFDPDGAGLGNLFNRISPLEALGIWPSGDFRLEPGDGFAPAALLLAWRCHCRCGPRFRLVVVAQARRAFGAGDPRRRRRARALRGTSPARRTRRRRPSRSQRPLAMLVSARALAMAAPSLQQAVRIVRRRGIAMLFPRSASARARPAGRGRPRDRVCGGRGGLDRARAG